MLHSQTCLVGRHLPARILPARILPAHSLPARILPACSLPARCPGNCWEPPSPHTEDRSAWSAMAAETLQKEASVACKSTGLFWGKKRSFWCRDAQD